ncbi:ricin domain containing protein [Rhyzopertha dominica]|nr:ricin domain containing protein [Rhyzopertha dominica]
MLVALVFASITAFCLQTDIDTVMVRVQACDVNEVNQQWELESYGDGTFKIISNGNGKVLHVSDGIDGCPVGSEIITYDFHGGIHQRWYVGPDGRITPSCNKTSALDTRNHVAAIGTSLLTSTRNSDPAPTQTFEIVVLQNNTAT